MRSHFAGSVLAQGLSGKIGLSLGPIFQPILKPPAADILAVKSLLKKPWALLAALTICAAHHPYPAGW
ncbi:MAG: hypothetical protein COB08_017775 [Rhodobacteraceae bacterium]|nr:hypothetical protein [Paracoccaceae bacterium]